MEKILIFSVIHAHLSLAMLRFRRHNLPMPSAADQHLQTAESSSPIIYDYYTHSQTPTTYKANEYASTDELSEYLHLPSLAERGLSPADHTLNKWGWFPWSVSSQRTLGTHTCVILWAERVGDSCGIAPSSPHVKLGRTVCLLGI